jgi:hypothetical protein
MLRRRNETKKRAGEAAQLAIELAQDKKFRKQLLSALKHTDVASGRTRTALGPTGTLRRLASDETLRHELSRARADLQRAYARAGKRKTGHKLRNVTLIAGLASLAGLPQVRTRLTSAFAKAGKATGRISRLEDLTKEELYERAQRADIPGRSEMSKDQLVDALRSAR